MTASLSSETIENLDHQEQRSPILMQEPQIFSPSLPHSELGIINIWYQYQSLNFHLCLSHSKLGIINIWYSYLNIW